MGLGDGQLMVVSPGTGTTDAHWDELDKIGRVTTLLTPGPFHNMGLAAWKARYPDAGLYGTGASITHIAKAHPTLEALKPLTELSLPDGIHLEEHGGMGKPDIFMAITRDDATTWFTNEMITNTADWPGKLPFKFAFWLFKSGPGLNVNTLALKLVKGDKAAARTSVEGKLKSHAPTRLIPCHGGVINDDALADKLAEVVARRLG